MKIFICNKLYPYFVIYSKEINKILNNNQFVTKDWSNADYLITCISQEQNYPIYGNMEYARPRIQIDYINAFIKGFRLNPCNKLVIFQNSPTVFDDNVINVCYAKNDYDYKNILICPPAIKRYNFNNTVNKN